MATFLFYRRDSGPEGPAHLRGQAATRALAHSLSLALALALPPALPPALPLALSLALPHVLAVAIPASLFCASAFARTDNRPDESGVRFLEDIRLARAALYPGYDEASMQTRESFRSPSLKLKAADMALRDFKLAAVPPGDSASTSQPFVASAMLKPLGFPKSYTLLEVALLDREHSGEFRLRKNLKVRVDSGTGEGELLMALGEVFPTKNGAVRFDVVVTEDGRALRHRFIHDGKRLRLIASVGVD